MVAIESNIRNTSVLIFQMFGTSFLSKDVVLNSLILFYSNVFVQFFLIVADLTTGGLSSIHQFSLILHTSKKCISVILW